MFTTNVLQDLTKSYSVRNYHTDFVSFDVVRFVVAIGGAVVFEVFDFYPVESQSQVITSLKGPLICSSTFCGNCGLEQIVLALCV